MKILVSGGANGLGESITKVLLQQNHNVYFTYCKSREKAIRIEKEYKNATAVHYDFFDRESVLKLKASLKDWDLDVIVNNAYHGSFIKTYFHKIPLQDFESEFQSNVLAFIDLNQEVISGFRKKKFGKIITILSSALVGSPPIGSSIYSANKAYIREICKMWVIENQKFNITSNTVSPAFMKTDFTKQIDERLVEQMIENHPLKKMLSPQEVADSILFLVNSGQQINGLDIVINAGTYMK